MASAHVRWSRGDTDVPLNLPPWPLTFRDLYYIQGPLRQLVRNSAIIALASVLVCTSIVYISWDRPPSLVADISQKIEISSGVQPAGCVVIQNARYLKNTGGFQVGHWGMTLAQIIGGLKKNGRLGGDGEPEKEIVDKVYHLILDDDIAKRNGAKRLLGIEQAFKHSEFARTTLAVLKRLMGVRLELQERTTLNTGFSCAGGTIRVDAGLEPQDDTWITMSGPNPALDMAAAAVEALGCNQTSSDDILIYNRKPPRHIENEVPLAIFLQSLGYKTKIAYTSDFSPREQICEMTRERKLIITPHGAHQSPLLFKRDGVGVVVVSPRAALTECYRHVVKDSEPWFSVRGDVGWSCSEGRICSESPGAWKNRLSCGNKCTRNARRVRKVQVSLKAMREVLRVADTEEKERY